METTSKAEERSGGARSTRLARLEWDFRIARSMGSLKAWRAQALLATGCLLAVILWAGAYLQKPKLVPYVVEVRGDQVSFKGVIQATKLTITDAVVRNYLIRFVTHLRTVSTDPVVLKENLLDLYGIAGPSAQRQITEYIAQSDPFKKASRGERVDVRFTLFERIAEGTWRVEWIEELRDQGELTSSRAMAGTFSYTQGFPSDDREAEENPFGLYFTDFFIAERRD